MYLHQPANVELGSLQDLDFTNENIQGGIDTWCNLLNLSTNDLKDELWEQVSP